MFNPSSNLSFKDWIQKWTSHLIAKVSVYNLCSTQDKKVDN